MPQATPELVNSVICCQRRHDVRVALVPAPTLGVAEPLHEAGDVRRFREVRRHRDEQWTAVVRLRERVDPRAPRREGRAVRLLIAGLRPHRLGVVLVIEDALVLEDVLGSSAKEERGDLVRDGACDVEQPVGEVVGHVGPLVKHRRGDLEIPPCLRRDSAGVLWRGLVHAFVLDPVLLLEFLAQLPEQLVVHRVRRPVRGVVVLQIPAAFPRSEPAEARRLLRILAARGLEYDLGQSSHSLPRSVPMTRHPYGSNQSRGPP